MALPDVVTLLSNNPTAVVALGIVMRLARAYQADLSWPEYRAIHRVKRGVFPLLQRTVPVVSWVNEKRGRDDAEYVMTTPASVRETVRALREAGGTLHAVCSIKRRPDGHGDPLTAAHVAWFVGDEQVEAYLFRNSDGSTDLYCHTEASIDNPLAHLSGGQTDGDAHGVLPDAYDGQ